MGKTYWAEPWLSHWVKLCHSASGAAAGIQGVRLINIIYLKYFRSTMLLLG